MLGHNKAVITTRKSGPPATLPGALVSRWGYNEDGSTVADEIGNSDGVASNLTRGNPLINENGQSGIGNGTSTDVAISHNASMLLPSYSVVLWIQNKTTPSSGNRVFFVKDAPGMPGGVSIEQNNNGLLRAYTKNSSGSAIWIGGSSGVGDLPDNTASLVVLVVDPNAEEPTQLWLRNDGDASATKVGTTTNTQGWQSNTEDVHHLSYRGTGAYFDGYIDRVELYNGPITEQQINNLPEPISIEEAVAPPSGSFECVNATGTLYADHKNKGETFARRSLTRGGNARYDFRGTTCNNTYNDSTKTYSPSYNIWFSNNHDGGCLFGATVLNGYIGQGKYGPRRYPDNHGGQIQIWEASVRNFLIDGCRFHACWDPVRTSPKSPNVAENIRIKACHMTDVYDDAVENDEYSRGIDIEECLIDGCFVFYSARVYGKASKGGTSTISNTLVRMEPFYDNYWVGQIFKLAGGCPNFLITDCIFHLGTPAPGGNPTYWENGDPFKDLAVNYPSKVAAGSGNNVIVWVGGGAYPFSVPPSFTVTTDESVWNNAKANWLATHDYVPTIPGVD